VDGVHLVDTHAVQVIGRLLHGVQHGGGIAVREWDHQVRAGTDVVEHRLWRKRARPVGHRAAAISAAGEGEVPVGEPRR